MGSGVKASILATLTTKIISTMMAQNMPIDECVSAIAATLPVCSLRQIAYSTFTIIRITHNSRAEIIQFDNPGVVLLRKGKHYEFPRSTRTIGGKTIHISELAIKEGDVFVAFSDGVEHAGVGRTLNFGWQRNDIIRFLEGLYKSHYTAHTLTGVLINQCRLLYEDCPGDDATVCVMRASAQAGQPAHRSARAPRGCAQDDGFVLRPANTLSAAPPPAFAEHLGKPLDASLPDKDRPCHSAHGPD